MTFDIGLHEVCVRVGVRYVITKFSRMDSLPNFVTHDAPLRALRARELRYYGNKISSLIRMSKKYYSDYFEANMSNIKNKKKLGQVLISYRFAVKKSSTLLLKLRTLSIRIN